MLRPPSLLYKHRQHGSVKHVVKAANHDQGQHKNVQTTREQQPSWDIARRTVVYSPLLSLTAYIPTPPVAQSFPVPNDVCVPLELDGGVFCLKYLLDGHQFRGVLDTGSPFLTVSTNASPFWGSWNGEGQKTDLPDTLEMFATQDGEVEWRQGNVLVPSKPALSYAPITNHPLVFGVFRSLIAKGGVSDQSLVGLVKHTSPGIRPSLLGQTGFRSFTLDCASHSLTLSYRSLLPSTRGSETISLVDLRQVGAPSQQYVVRVKSLFINDMEVTADRPIFAMIDSGSTGMYISEQMFYALQWRARGWKSCTVEFETKTGGTATLSAGRPSPLFLCFPTAFPWLSEDEGYMVVLGMAFLKDLAITIDMDESEMLLTRANTA